MSNSEILMPALMLVGWTLAVLLLIPYQRFKATGKGIVGPGDFRYGESARVPVEVSIPNRNFMNLLEVPLLFYFLSLCLYLSGSVSPLAQGLAWLYLGLRVAHSLIHLSYNNVIHRLLVFASSNVVLLGLWILLLLRLG